MAKIGEFKGLFTCLLCKQILKEPVLLPCGESICRTHSEDVCSKTCTFCIQEHSLPEEGFASNKIVQKMLDLEVDRISLKSASYDKCQKGLDELKKVYARVDSILQDPQNLIYEHFSEIKNTADLKKEKITLELNDWYEQIIKDINQAQDICEKELSNNLFFIQKLSEDVSRSDYNKLVEQIESFEIGDFNANNYFLN